MIISWGLKCFQHLCWAMYSIKSAMSYCNLLSVWLHFTCIHFFLEAILLALLVQIIEQIFEKTLSPWNFSAAGLLDPKNLSYHLSTVPVLFPCLMSFAMSLIIYEVRADLAVFYNASFLRCSSEISIISGSFIGSVSIHCKSIYYSLRMHSKTVMSFHLHNSNILTDFNW